MPVRFTSLYGTARYGFSDERVTGRLTLRTDAPGGRYTIAGYREVQSVDPYASGRVLENSLDALFAAHDDADYAAATGVSAGAETSVGVGVDFAAGAWLERQRSAARTAKSAINDALGGTGFFPPNPPVDEETYGGMFVRFDGFGGHRWMLTADVVGTDDRATARVFGEYRHGFGSRQGGTLRLKSGIGAEPVFAQTAFRLGGTQTVRGFPYGRARGPAFWSAQLDVTPFGWLIRPVAFLDAGQTGPVGDLFSRDVLVGGGIGLSLFRGLIRFDFSVPVTPDVGGKNPVRLRHPWSTMRGRCIALGLVAATGACQRPKPEPGGRLESRWTGADTAQFAATATAQWCAMGKYVEIQAVRGDTGILVAVFPKDTGWAGTYRLTAAPDEASRPTALVVWRWADLSKVDGVRSDSGTVQLRREPGGKVSGKCRSKDRFLAAPLIRWCLPGAFVMSSSGHSGGIVLSVAHAPGIRWSRRWPGLKTRQPRGRIH